MVHLHNHYAELPADAVITSYATALVRSADLLNAASDVDTIRAGLRNVLHPPHATVHARADVEEGSHGLRRRNLRRSPDAGTPYRGRRLCARARLGNRGLASGPYRGSVRASDDAVHRSSG